MKPENEILELLKEKDMMISELREEFTSGGVSTGESRHVDSVLTFLQKYKLVEIVPTDEGGLVKITPRGLQLLNLPNLPEDETTGEEITELTLIGQKMADKTINLYSLSQHTETANWIDAMAMRFNVSGNDVIRAMWAIAKDTVGAKLERDVKEKKKRK